MISLKRLSLSVVTLFATMVSVVPISHAQVDLNVELKQALCSQDWQKTLRVLDRMIVASPEYATEIRVYRGRIAAFAQKKVKFPNWTTGCFDEKAPVGADGNTPATTPATPTTPTVPSPTAIPLPSNSIPISLDNKTLECNFFTDNGEIGFNDLGVLTDQGQTLSEGQLSKAIATLQQIIGYWQKKEVKDPQLQQVKDQLISNYTSAIRTINLLVYEGRSGSFVGQARESENLQKEVAQETAISQQVTTYCASKPAPPVQ